MHVYSLKCQLLRAVSGNYMDCFIRVLKQDFANYNWGVAAKCRFISLTCDLSSMGLNNHLLDKVNVVAEQIDETDIRKIPQIAWAESSSTFLIVSHFVASLRNTSPQLT
jgi:hypothetical protein